MIVTKKFSFDLDTRGISPLMYAVQGDVNTRKVEISLFSNGTAWEIPDGTVVAVAYRKPDGTSGLYDKLPSGESASEVSENVVTVMLAPQVLTCAGNVVASVVFYSQDMADTLATFSFQIHVEKNPGAGQQISNNYYALQNLEQVNAAYNDLLERVLALEQGGGSGQNVDYDEVTNKPKINGVELSGDKSLEDLGIGTPTDEQVKESVAEWLDEHPEATTTVQDGSITEKKLSDDLKESLKNAAKTVKMSNILNVGAIFDKPEGLPYCGWPFNNVQYDPELNAILFLINAAVKHGDNGNTHLYMGKLDLDTYGVEIKEIGNPDALGHGFYTMGFCINSNGEYLYVDAQSKTLGKSANKGESWTETSVSEYSAWPESITQLSNGRYLFWSDGWTNDSGGNAGRSVWYSDDDCATWKQATISSPKFEGHFLELTDGVVMCFMRKSTQGTDNGAWNGNKIQEPIVISISYDYGATWTAATDSTTLLEGCANIATAFYHKDEDLVEVFTSPRYPYGDTMGAIWQYIATSEDALNDNFGTPKAVLYSKALAYQDFGHIGGCLDGKGDMHLMYYDGDASASGSVNYHYMKASRGQAVIPVHSNAMESLFLPYSAKDATAQLMAVRAELMAKINAIILENGGTVEDENFYVTDALKFDFDLTNTEKYDTDAGTITDTFGNVANTTFTDGAISADVKIPVATFAEKLTDTSQLTLELCVDVITPAATNNGVLLETTTYKYDYTPIKARQVFGLYTNSSGADSSTGATSIQSWNGTLSASTVGTANPSQASLLYVSGTQHIVLTMDTDGTYVLYAKGEILHTGTIDDFGSWNALISRGIKARCSDIYTLLSFRVYNKALTADEVMQNYNYCKALYG